MKNQAKTIVVVGPAGAGKSTVAKKIAQESEGVWAYISQDDIRDLIYAGWESAAQQWNDDVKKQWEVSHRISVDMMRRYQEAGINSIADGFSPSLRGDYKLLAEYLKDLNYILIVILPSLEATLQRNSNRSGDARLPDEYIENMYGWYTNFVKEASNAVVVNSTNMDVDQVVRKIQKVINEK